MSLREWMNRNQTMATLIVVGILVVAMGVIAMQMRSPGAGRAPVVYFWDMDRGEAFTARRAVPPIEAPSGGEGVWAHLFTCGECTPDEWFGYLEKYTDEAAAVLRHEPADLEAGPGLTEDWQFLRENQSVRSLDNGPWVRHYSREGERIREQINDRCGPDAFPRRCRP